jgi:hypothetical protein
MTNLMIQLRRSPRTLLERDGHPGPGAGHLGLVMARAGVGKTAFLVGIGIDALLAGQKVLHVSLDRTVDKVRTWYDDLLMEMLRREKQLQHWAGIQLEVERRRHIHTYVGQSFTVDRFRQGLELIGSAMDFKPQVIILDRVDLEEIDPSEVEALRAVAGETGAELWMACRTHRDDPEPAPGQLPSPADRFQESVDTAFSLNPIDDRIRLQVAKDLNILLDPKTLLLTTGLPRR